MDESARLLQWLLKNTLERHYAGNKTLMAQDLEIDRHTLVRSLKYSESKKSRVSSLVAQQLLWCCMRYSYSLDDSFLAYLEQYSHENTQQCNQVKRWMQNVQAGILNTESGVMREIVKQVIPELLVILECSQMNDQQGPHPSHCKFKHVCPILKLIAIAKAESSQ